MTADAKSHMLCSCAGRTKDPAPNHRGPIPRGRPAGLADETLAAPAFAILTSGMCSPGVLVALKAPCCVLKSHSYMADVISLRVNFYHLLHLIYMHDRLQGYRAIFACPHSTLWLDLNI